MRNKQLEEQVETLEQRLRNIKNAKEEDRVEQTLRSIEDKLSQFLVTHHKSRSPNLTPHNVTFATAPQTAPLNRKKQTTNISEEEKEHEEMLKIAAESATIALKGGAEYELGIIAKPKTNDEIHQKADAHINQPPFLNGIAAHPNILEQTNQQISTLVPLDDAEKEREEEEKLLQKIFEEDKCKHKQILKFRLAHIFSIEKFNSGDTFSFFWSHKKKKKSVR